MELLLRKAGAREKQTFRPAHQAGDQSHHFPFSCCVFCSPDLYLARFKRHVQM